MSPDSEGAPAGGRRRASDRLVALVTGATGGIGRAIAMELASRQMGIVLAGRHRQKLEGVREELMDPSVRVVAFDLTAAAQVDAAAALAGPIDILVHAAGVYAAFPPALATTDAIAYQFSVHVSGPARLTAHLLPSLRRRKGQVVFVGSSVLDRVTSGLEGYASAKFGQRSYADNLRRQVNPDGVRVLVIHPGRTATRIQEAIHRAEGRPYEAERLVQPGDIARIVADTLLLPRTVEVTDIHLRPAARPRGRRASPRPGSVDPAAVPGLLADATPLLAPASGPSAEQASRSGISAASSTSTRQPPR